MTWAVARTCSATDETETDLHRLTTKFTAATVIPALPIWQPPDGCT